MINQWSFGLTLLHLPLYGRIPFGLCLWSGETVRLVTGIHFVLLFVKVHNIETGIHFCQSANSCSSTIYGVLLSYIGCWENSLEILVWVHKISLQFYCYLPFLLLLSQEVSQIRPILLLSQYLVDMAFWDFNAITSFGMENSLNFNIWRVRIIIIILSFSFTQFLLGLN